jgi:hypothetical protein
METADCKVRIGVLIIIVVFSSSFGIVFSSGNFFEGDIMSLDCGTMGRILLLGPSNHFWLSHTFVVGGFLTILMTTVDGIGSRKMPVSGLVRRSLE